jgi:uncharacterized membrane-anchored protein YitT (DUF2179 family)
LKKICILLFSSICIGSGLNLFLESPHLINGGVFGIILFIKYIWGIKVSYMMIIINTPIYLLSLLLDRA